MGLLREEIEFRSTRAKSELVNELGLAIGRTGQSRASSNIGYAREFEGVVSTQGFRIKRVPKWGYNGFMPECSGTIESEDGKTTIYADIRLTKPVRLFLIFFFMFGLLLIIPSLSDLWSPNTPVDPKLDEIMKETLSEVDYENYSHRMSSKSNNSFVWSTIKMNLIALGGIIVIFKYESNRIRTWLNCQLEQD